MGVPPGDPAWGIMVSEGRDQIFDIWWLALFPGLAITIVVMAMNFFGDWLRDTLDPRLRRDAVAGRRRRLANLGRATVRPFFW